MPHRTTKHPTLRLVTTNGCAVAAANAPARVPLAADEQFLLTFYRAAPQRIKAILQRAASLMAQEASR